jgi:localization factor PodJL
MNSRVSWSVDGIDPNVRERAEAAARHAGMSLNDWLNSTLGQSSIVPSSLVQSSHPQSSLPQSSFGASSVEHSMPPNYRTASPEREAREVADIHQRLDLITRQIERISRPAARPEPQRGEQGVAHQLNEAISRLDARLSQISNPAPARQSQLQEKQRLSEMVERAADQIYRSSPPLSPASLDLAVAEIAARQTELDNAAPAQTPPRSAPPIVTGPATRRPIAAPAMQAGPDFSALERHLFKITSQIEALQKPDGIETSIAGFRSELAEIRQALTEAMPRRAIESIESEVRALSRRIEDNSQSSTDVHALAGIQSALGEIREVLKSLTPAEQLAGYDEAIRNLGAKLDLILRANDNPGTVRQLETAIAALRNIVSNVASNDALARLSNDVHLLSSKVDQLTRAGDNTNSFAILEQRIAALTSTLESREQPAGERSERFEGAVQALSDRLDRMPVGNDSASAFAHLEQRVSYLLERIEASGERGGNLGRVEDALQDILRHLESQHATFTAFAEQSRNAGAPQPPDSDIVDLVKRELSDIRFSQSKTERQTQDSLEVVHNTLGHVVDRLAMIEGDLRTAHFAPPEPAAAIAFEAPSATYRAATPPQPRPELPNPAAAESYFAAAPREFHAVQTPAAAIAPVANSDILEPEIAQSLRAALQPDLPPDHPLEPGTRPSARSGSPSERIAASESVISEIAAAPREPVNSSSFIAAARRAAQAAAAAQPAEKSGRVSSVSSTGGKAIGQKASGVTSKIRSLLIAASVVVIVLSGFKMAMTLLDSSSGSQLLGFQNSSEPPASAQSPADSSATPGSPDPTSSMTSPTPIGRQSNNTSGPNTLDTASLTIPRATAPITSSSDITGSIPAMTGKLAMVQVPPTERLPDGIGGAMLRAAALKGDAAAAYEIALRFAEGRGVAQNLEEAAKWYDRAAQAGMMPAVFRLGTLYEKGLGVNKDTDIARRYYLQAAERGNAKAMHNLAVLDADGGGKGANYISASQWFRKAAERGVADSQFNLGILYARGIGVEQNLAESFKWFSLAAVQGDADAGRKRDEIAKRLDAQSLAAANLAMQTFTPEPQPDDAVNVGTPVGGWDGTPASAATTKPAAKQAFKRAAALH